MLFLLISLWIVLCQSPVLSDSNCTGVECDGPSLSCPSDSNFDSGKCTCDASLCKLPPTCYNSQQLVLVKSATKIPGDCCDVYECLDKPGTNCSQVECPKESNTCPSDSYKLPTGWHPGDCCGTSLGCQCLPSPCEKPICSDGEVPFTIRAGTGRPGSCCPDYQCISKDMIGLNCENGTTWLNSDCEKCTCDSKGIKLCYKVECPKLSDQCAKTDKPKGQCCPVCLEESPPPFDDDSKTEEPSTCLLDDNGVLLNVGDSYWRDPCINCKCLRGGTKPRCEGSSCEISCVNPRYDPKECCPRCDPTSLVVLGPHCSSLTNCTLRCESGFVQTEDGCISCQCEQEKCVLDCPFGYVKNEDGDNICKCASSPVTDCPSLDDCFKKCPYGRKKNKEGCEVCRCVHCPSMNECVKKCTNGYQKDERGCLLCKCQTTTTDENSACYTENGIMRDDSEIWRDGCRECHCIEGREMCTLVSCPPLTCEHPVPANASQCCSYCPDTSDKLEVSVCMNFHGELKLEGQRWTLNDCTDCTCREGKVLCYSQQCPPAACSNPVDPEPGNCCPICMDSEEINVNQDSGEIENQIGISDDGGDMDCGDKKNGSSWRESNCVSCRCDKGHRICYQQECPHTKPCDKSVQPKNACCPTCLDTVINESEKVCIDGNVTYTENQQWKIDRCTSCSCRDGNRQCTQRICSVPCSKPVNVPNECCPICLDDNSNSSANDKNESSTNKQIKETLYILLIVLFCVSTMFAIYACRQLRNRRNRLRLQDYGCPPPQYQYKYIPTYESPDRNKNTSDEKTSLAPV